MKRKSLRHTVWIHQLVLEPLFRSSTIHVSATLDPVWLYTNMTGIVNFEFKSIKNIFPASNLLVLYRDDLTTKYSEFGAEMADKYVKVISDIVTGLDRKSMVFFPSFNTMQYIETKVKFPHLSESRSMTQRDFQHLISLYRKENRPLFGVMGGRLSEGINLPGNLLEVEIIAGIPFPKPTIKQRALSSYYDLLFGSGWQYAFLFPAIIKIRQTMGRVIRSEEDIGVIIILDGRVQMLEPYINARLSNNIRDDINSFFSSHIK